jgi:hypothetical protein
MRITQKIETRNKTGTMSGYIYCKLCFLPYKVKRGQTGKEKHVLARQADVMDHPYTGSNYTPSKPKDLASQASQQFSNLIPFSI